jgi:two-component system response regulator GlrR
VFALLEKVAPTEATVLLEGETGTGKELFAEAIRQGSPRARGPFVIIDCGTIPANLIESELFGHMRGSFTGATADRAGAFEAADGGTLFLDELGELPLDMQPKLLRALENRTIKRIGSTQQTKIDVRVIAATNRDLRAEVNRGNFRADLYYRLNVVRVKIPPLRERREDIALLVSHFYGQLAGEDDASPPAELINELARHSWPGNVRELRSAVQRAVLLGNAQWRDLTDPGVVPALEGAFDHDYTIPFRIAKERAVASWEKGYVAGLVRDNLGNLSRAARAVRMDRNHLRELLRKYGIAKDDDSST